MIFDRGDKVTIRQEDGNPSAQAVFRIGVILVLAVVIFVIVRQMMIPASFGQYGRYRGNSISENASLNAAYAGSSNDCGECHQQEFMALAQAQHREIDCQSCHGPAAKHVSKPAVTSPIVQETAELCNSCHRQIAGRQDGKIVTVRPLLHSGGVNCTRCHNPHRPQLSFEGDKS